MEHGMMRDLFQELRQELGRRNGERCLGLCETLLVLMQQHNLKEEQILYRMADNILADERPRLLVRLAASACWTSAPCRRPNPWNAYSRRSTRSRRDSTCACATAASRIRSTPSSTNTASIT